MTDKIYNLGRPSVKRSLISRLTGYFKSEFRERIVGSIFKVYGNFSSVTIIHKRQLSINNFNRLYLQCIMRLCCIIPVLFFMLKGKAIVSM